VLALAFLVAVRSMIKRTRAAREQAAAEAAAEAAQAAKRAASDTSAPRPLRERVAAAVQTDPDAASDVLKSWYSGTATPKPERAAAPQGTAS
jgi:type II secretory pathway pseudopilin PulG